MKTIYDFNAVDINNNQISFDQFKGKSLLIVNVASKCGFTPQYEGLEKIYQSEKENGLIVLGFPCNQFGGQDPGSAEDIGAFCQRHYGVSFAMMEKVEVNGAQAHPLFVWLKSEAPGVLGTEGIKWNFTKFLIGRDGQVKKRYAPQDAPDKLVSDIEEALSAAPCA